MNLYNVCMKTAKIRIFDGHNDTLTAIKGQEGITGFLQGGSKLHVDMSKAHAGNMAGGCFAVFIDAPDKGRPLSHGYASNEAQKCVDLLGKLQECSEGNFGLCRNYADIASAFASDSMAALLHFEGAEPIAADLSDLGRWYDLGLRSVGITWSRANAFGLGVGFGFGHSSDNGPGLTP
ncbi:MAG: membrane dipeptidase, partial [Sedimentisphaerales bacterium]|nr:membrane dipeptidase [Sedimentisphaerales bacterium]